MKLKLQQNHLINIFINCIIILCFSVNMAFGQDNDETECPYFNVFSTDTTGVSFALLSTNIDATISGVIANVEIEQTYYNAGDSTINATYVFPMSTNAAVYGMQMVLDGRTIDAVIKRRSEAQTIFENAEEAGLTASLLR